MYTDYTPVERDFNDLFCHSGCFNVQKQRTSLINTWKHFTGCIEMIQLALGFIQNCASRLTSNQSFTYASFVGCLFCSFTEQGNQSGQTQRFSFHSFEVYKLFYGRVSHKGWLPVRFCFRSAACMQFMQLFPIHQNILLLLLCCASNKD